MRIKIKKLIAIALALSLTLALLPVFSVPAQAAGETLITTAAEFYAIDDSAANLAKSYILMADINIGNNFVNGTFTGTFDGNGHTITASISMTYPEVGVFRVNSGTIKNLKVAGSVTGTNAYVGGIAGKNTGTVRNCYVSASVSATNNTSGDGRGAGGIAGYNSIGTITNCYTTGTVSAAGSRDYLYAGGIAAWNQSTISYCYATGAVSASGGTAATRTGGIAGFGFGGTISSCVALNSSLSTTGTGISARRVVGDSGTLTDNYGKTGMSALSDTSVVGLADPNGSNIDPTTAQQQTWWSSTKASAWTIGTASQTYPWTWNSANKRPQLYWETRYNVTFNANEGSGSMASMSLPHGMPHSLTSNTYTRTGYTYAGWNTNSSGTGTNYANGASVSITSNLNLYARWTAYTYSVKFNANGGSGTMSNQSHSYGSSLALTANSFGKEGYTFMGWDTDSAGTTVVYTDGESVSNLTSTNGATVNLYAVWAINIYTLTIDYDGGDTETEQIIQEYNTQYIITDPTRDGYVFDGWTHTGGGTIASNGNGSYTYTFADSDGTITARWISTRQTGVSVTDSTGYFNVTNSNLDVVIEEVIEPNERDKVVSLTLNVTDNADPSEVEAIKTVASGGSEVYFFDATLTKIVDGNAEALTEVPVPVEIHIALTDELAGKTYYRVYRYHDNQAEAISSDPSKPEHYTVDVANSEIIIRTMKFSTYAIFGNDAPIDLGTGYDVDVQAKIFDGGGGVYKIDIAWGAMAFEYSTSGIWNSDTHEYDNSTEVGWKKEGFMYGNNKITAWNHSNSDVLVSFDVTENALPSVTMVVNKGNEYPGDAATGVLLEKVQSERAAASSINAYLRLDGAPDNPSSLQGDYIKVAVITVTVAAEGEERTPQKIT